MPPNILPKRYASHTTTIPPLAVVDDIVANFTSGNYGLDGPQLSAINATSFDWWYFDVVSPDLQTSLVVVFFTALDSGFPFLAPSTNVDAIAVFYTFPNGTGSTIFLYAEEAIVTTTGDASSGYYPGTNSSWTGSPDLSQYHISINSPENGLVGTFDLQSLAPAHYPCSAAVAGQTMEVAPNIGWSNAVADAVGEVDMTILGEELKFTGVAYHDKNWSNQPFSQNVNSWVWGHGRLGNYSIVWFDTLSSNNTEFVSAYAALDGVIVASSCDPSSLVVRPTGPNDQYPPSVLTGDPGGFNITMDLGDAGTLSIDVTIVTTIADAGEAYKRWTGSMRGRNCCGEEMEGVALLEQFKLVE
ncbi:Tyrosinase family protein asqI [Lachnellula suecica]|uniref:Tyrosinase family protein asqI n=1 Tax=Lachnellula suecica TaxID=602035 RepID=A0A8T9CES0_9HELO|nr:Tyrosinase family protein asqI [Lachnellula suecica]